MMVVTKNSVQTAVEAETVTAQNIANKHDRPCVIFSQEIGSSRCFVGFQLLSDRDIKAGQWFKYGNDDLFAEKIIYPSKIA